MGFDSRNGVLLRLKPQWDGYSSAFEIKFKNTSTLDVTLHSVSMESISPTGQVINSHSIGQDDEANPGNLPFLLAPGESLTMETDFSAFSNPVTVSTATYLGSTCKVTGWY
ncbi:MAG TPA: hypothetical protein VMV92_20710 [Streptosporangiaceae bacterium]|nr:hypothetical protein [Streptosporangiaceae bacterium]